ncbi:MAG: hypothetical protein ISN26_06120 [Betaproteobacteria bacterium AqS2]|uniref:Uncharacterized protein n=1 Tax=Candidatus Amphirhobacter heronislandensis TaxID=1732024 RepID=A0A930UH81_9GAMM|nr:hypothetical protein [Betaproteobacteria bacterium AqS2]
MAPKFEPHPIVELFRTGVAEMKWALSGSKKPLRAHADKAGGRTSASSPAPAFEPHPIIVLLRTGIAQMKRALAGPKKPQ